MTQRNCSYDPLCCLGWILWLWSDSLWSIMLYPATQSRYRGFLFNNVTIWCKPFKITRKSPKSNENMQFFVFFWCDKSQNCLCSVMLFGSYIMLLGDILCSVMLFWGLKILWFLKNLHKFTKPHKQYKKSHAVVHFHVKHAKCYQAASLAVKTHMISSRTIIYV